MIHDTDLLTGDDNLNLAKDTLFAQTYSVFEQPLSSNAVSAGVLGNFNDPNFGSTSAGFYAQCRLTSNNVSFGSHPVLDSAVLTLRYAGSYGKCDQPTHLVVYELNQGLVDSIPYKTNDALQVNATAIGQLNGFVPDFTDSVYVLGLAYEPHIRIPLTTAFGNKLLLTDTTNLVDNTAFLNFFKGFYATTSTSPAGNGILSINLLSYLSKISLYYHNDTDDSLSYDIPVSGVTVNHFDNVYTSAPVYSSVNNPSPNGESKMYLQGGAGVKGKILFPDFDSLPKNIAVNKAEIIFSQSEGDTAYPTPLLLDLFRIDATGTAQKLEDDGLIHFGGVQVAESVNGLNINRYRFNITKYFQRLIEGTYPNNGFYLQILGANSNSERVVIANSTTNENYRINLVVTYTKL